MLNKLNKLKREKLESGLSDTSDQVVFYQSAIYAIEVSIKVKTYIKNPSFRNWQSQGVQLYLEHYADLAKRLRKEATDKE